LDNSICAYSLLHRLIFAPCPTHTPPCRLSLVYPSLLHVLLFALCLLLLHTPPCQAWLVNPSLLYCFLLIRTPPRKAIFVHPLAEHVCWLEEDPGMDLVQSNDDW